MKGKRFYENKAFRWILAGLLAFVLVSSNVVDNMVRIYANEEGQVDQVDNSAAEEAARQAEEAARREAEEAARRAEEEAARKAQEETARKAAEEEAARKAAEEEAARKAAEEEAARKAAEAAQKAAEEEAAREAAEEAAAAEAAQKAAEEEAARKAQEEAERKAAEEAEKPTEFPVTAAPTEAPTQAPTAAPTQAPTEAPTEQPTEAPTEAPTEEPTAEPEATVEPTLEPTVTPEPTLEPTPEPVAPGTATFYIWVDGAYEEAGSAQITREGNACYVSKDDVQGLCADLGLKESETRGAWTWGIGNDAKPGNANSRLNWNNGRYEFPGYDEKAAGSDVFVIADKAFNVSTEQEEKPVETAAPTEVPTEEPDATVEATLEPDATIAPEATVETTLEPETTEQPVTESETALYTATINVNGKSANVREAANADSALVGRIFDGASVEVFAEVDGWYLVQGESVDRAPIKGYVSAKFIKQGAEPVATPEPTAEPTVEPEATVVPTMTPEPPLEPTVPPETETTLAPYEYQRGEDGALVLDKSGNPIAIVPEGAEIPVSFKRDETGALVLDENGNPIPLSTVPADADKISSILDELNPERYIDVYASYEGDTLSIGDDVTLIAVLYGYENTENTLQWQVSDDDVTWRDVVGATADRYTFTITDDNYANFWRVAVAITDVTAM